MLRFFRKKSGPPSPSDVASRTLILKSQIVAGMAIPPPEMLQHLLASWSSADGDQFLEQCRQRQAQAAGVLKKAGVWSAMSLSERAFMLALPHQIDGQALRNVSWLMESADCLLWALGNVEELPPYDTQSDTEHLKRLPSDGIVALIRNATLRDAGAISRARDVAELWHWRSRTRQLLYDVSTTDPLTFGVVAIGVAGSLTAMLVPTQRHERRSSTGAAAVVTIRPYTSIHSRQRGPNCWGSCPFCGRPRMKQ